MSKSIKPGTRIRIPAAEIEFLVGQNTIWVHGPQGSTLLRIKCSGQIKVDTCRTSSTSHADLMVAGDIDYCISLDAKVGG